MVSDVGSRRQSGEVQPSVLQVLMCDDLGGTELMVVRLVLGLRKMGMSSDVAILARAGPIASALDGHGVDVQSLGDSWGTVGASYRLGRLLSRTRYDIINVYGFKASMVARMLGPMCGRRTAIVCGVQGLHVAEVEDLGSWKARVARRLEGWCSPLVDAYETNSRGAVRWLAELGVSGSKVYYVPNGIDVPEWEPKRRAGVNTGVPMILCTARFVERKRQRDLVRALGILEGWGIEWHAVLAGYGPTLPACRELAVSLGLDDMIEFPGTVTLKEHRELLDRSSVFCLPSAWEGMPTVLLEAMARGVPVVGTAVNGTDDLVIEGRTGCLVPAGDPVRLAQSLRSILTSPAEAERYALEARRLVEREYSVERMLQAKWDLYRQVARDAAPRGHRHKPGEC